MVEPPLLPGILLQNLICSWQGGYTCALYMRVTGHTYQTKHSAMDEIVKLTIHTAHYKLFSHFCERLGWQQPVVITSSLVEPQE